VLGASDDLNTITSELFGHERGAFSGATQKRVGLVEYASGGTLILDEVLNLPPQAQSLLLDFVQFGTYRPLGYDKPQPKHASVRLIAATNGDLHAAMRERRFREDLYYRLASVTLVLPPLRDRQSDVPVLAESALRRADPSRDWTLSLDLRRWLASGAHEWPGNVRELEWVIRRAHDRALMRDPGTSQVSVRDLGELASAVGQGSAGPTSCKESPGEAWKRLQGLKDELERSEAEILRRALEQHDGVVAHVAKELGIARTTLAGRVDALGLSTRK
jgi:transcriptional regulator with GAF, ATPase, and Fis domain